MSSPSSGPPMKSFTGLSPVCKMENLFIPQNLKGSLPFGLLQLMVCGNEQPRWMVSEAMCWEKDTSKSFMHAANTMHVPPTKPIVPSVISTKFI